MVDLKRMLERETEEFYDRQDFPINDGISNYEIEEFNGFLHIKKYSGFDEDTIEIPAVINGKKVITIGENAFCGCLHLKHLIVPEGVQTIMNGAFYDCTHLEQVDLPQSLVHIGNELANSDKDNLKGAFENCKIEQIELPHGLQTIGPSAFGMCENLKSISISEGVTRIDQLCFAYCFSLEKILLPSSLRKIANRAFCLCSKLKNVYLSDGIEEIGMEAFNTYNSLDIRIPESVTKIADNAFGAIESNLTKPTIHCCSGSYALRFARTHNYSYERDDETFKKIFV